MDPTIALSLGFPGVIALLGITSVFFFFFASSSILFLDLYRWGYYLSSIFWDYAAPALTARPRISASLLREGFEDYEYLFKANGNNAPLVNVKEAVDDTAIRYDIHNKY
jgi:hypothetical protein